MFVCECVAMFVLNDPSSTTEWTDMHTFAFCMLPQVTLVMEWRHSAGIWATPAGSTRLESRFLYTHTHTHTHTHAETFTHTHTHVVPWSTFVTETPLPIITASLIVLSPPFLEPRFSSGSPRPSSIQRISFKRRRMTLVSELA